MDGGTCDGDLNRESCRLLPSDYGIYDAIASIRAIMASLSILGSLTIIILAIGRRQIFKSKIHPIFVLSMADFLLACLWIIGSSFWLSSSRIDGKGRIWCLVVSLLTIIAQCITINMALVYAIMVFYNLKRRRSDETQRLLSKEPELERVWGSAVTIGVYVIAWISPVLIVMASFGIVEGSSHFTKSIENCSCWCLPVYGNVLPYALPRDNATAEYTLSMYKLFASNGSVVSLEYLVVFTLLIVVYCKAIGHIKKLRQDPYYAKTHRELFRNGMTIPIDHGQSQAKSRVVLFLLVFLANGFFNFLLSLVLVFYEAYRIPQGGVVEPESNQSSARLIAFNTILALQSLTLPLQGFLNAIVYGWTRRDFVENMALLRRDLRQDPSDLPDNDHLPERYQKKDTKKNSSSLTHSRQLEITTNEYMESIQTTTETDTEA